MPPPKVILNLYPMLPSDGEEGRKKNRPLGRDSALYHRVLHDWLDIVKAADEMGVWGISAIEHHLHSEGYEVSPNPGILLAWWASHVKNARLGALGYVMATQDPIRVAEETAILDHITKGRFFVGLARGYQSRWTNILGQFSDTQATVSDGSAADRANRDIFEERTDMLIKCWTEESVVLDGKYYQAPYPLATGVENYPAHEITRQAGAPGEVDEAGSIRRVSVVPKPYQDPHPPVMVATSKSAESITYCAKKGFIPVHFSKLDKVVEYAQLYVDDAKSAGFDFALGERQNVVRWIHITDTEEEFDQRLLEWDLDIFKNLYAPFFPHMSADEVTDWAQTIKDSGIFLGGTVDTLKRQMRELYDAVPSEYLTLIFHYAQEPKDDVLRELKVFMEEIVPELDTPFA